jgi:hypothetical protein
MKKIFPISLLGLLKKPIKKKDFGMELKLNITR